MHRQLILLVVSGVAFAWLSSSAAAQAPHLSQTPALLPGVSYPGGGLATDQLSIDAEAYEGAEGQRHVGTGLLITGGVFGVVGVVSLALGGLSYALQNSFAGEAEPPTVLLAVGGGSLLVGLTLILIGVINRRAADEILQAPVAFDIEPTADGATVGLSGHF